MIAIAERHGDHDAARYVVEYATNTFQIVLRAEGALWKTGIAPHVHPEDAQIDASVATGPIDLRIREPHARFCFRDVCTRAD